MANSVDPDQVQSDLGLHCLQMPFCLKKNDCADNLYILSAFSHFAQTDLEGGKSYKIQTHIYLF